jgi:hypothetical protein
MQFDRSAKSHVAELSQSLFPSFHGTREHTHTRRLGPSLFILNALRVFAVILFYALDAFIVETHLRVKDLEEAGELVDAGKTRESTITL